MNEQADIATRLRPAAGIALSSYARGPEVSALCLEAADAIERLQAENQAKPWERCKDHGTAQPRVWACPQCLVELRAENQALRAELRIAREAAESWAGYAIECRKTKHDLAGTPARIDAAMKDHP